MNTKIVGGLLLALVLAGCGSANTGSNGTGILPPPTDPTVASGPVTGLGPLGVAGTQLNDTGTQVLLNASAARPAADLRLGMFADADGLVAPSSNTGIATTSVAQSLVLGPVTSLDAARQQLQVLGVPARVDTNTLIEGIERLEQVAVGDWVELYGLRLPAGEGILVTRLVAHRTPEDRSVEVLGAVSAVDVSSITTQGLRIELGTAQVGLASPAGIQPGVAALTAGTLVRVRGTYDPVLGQVTATLVTTGFAAARPEGKLVYVEGFVLEGTGTRVKVGDVEVDTASIGKPLTVGQRVTVRGRMNAGVLRVDQLAEVPQGARIEYVVEGPIETFDSLSSFTVRGERIDASKAVISGGDASLLGQGRRVRVRGIAGPGRLEATALAIVG